MAKVGNIDQSRALADKPQEAGSLRMKLPNFFILGANRAGTTSLSYYCGQHPDIYFCPVKEPMFFSSVSQGVAMEQATLARPYSCFTLSDYLRLFEKANQPMLGEGSTAYLANPRCAVWIKKMIPEAKLVTVLRNPIRRAFSSYRMFYGQGIEKRTFHEAIIHELTNGVVGLPQGQHYLKLGLYGYQLTVFKEYFSDEQIFIGDYEKYSEDIAGFLRELFEFLGVGQFTPPSLERLNTSETHYVDPNEMPLFDNLRFKKSLRKKLVAYYERDITELGKIVDFDVSHWVTDLCRIGSSTRAVTRRRMPDCGDQHDDTRVINWIDSILHEANELACGADGAEALSLLRRLPADVFWELILEVPRKYSGLGTLLPQMPSEEVQRNWTGNAGRPLFTQSAAFVRTLSHAYERYTGRSLEDAAILDYGCGWGRLVRLMYAFSPPSRVFGIDPWEESINICRKCGVLGQLAVCDYLPRSLPFEGVDFDLIYAFSVFTHLSERTAGLVQEAMRCRIKPDGLAVITVRPVEYWLQHREVLPTGKTRNGLMRAHATYGFAFSPHNRSPIEGEITYGDASISIEYIERNWIRWRVEGIETNAVDPYQVIVFLKPTARA
jgi:hypothetical protein